MDATRRWAAAAFGASDSHLSAFLSHARALASKSVMHYIDRFIAISLGYRVDVASYTKADYQDAQAELPNAREEQLEIKAVMYFYERLGLAEAAERMQAAANAMQLEIDYYDGVIREWESHRERKWRVCTNSGIQLGARPDQAPFSRIGNVLSCVLGAINVPVHKTGITSKL